MKKTKVENSRKILVLAIAILATCLFELIPPLLKGEHLSLEFHLIIGVLSFATPFLVDIYLLTTQFTKENKQEIELWETQHENEKELNNIRRNYYNIYHGVSKNDLFVAHFTREINELSKSIKDVANNGKLCISANHFLNTENVLDAFEGDKEKIWKYTWPIESDVSKLFDPVHWQQYFEVTYNMLKKGEIQKIHTILILENDELKDTPRIKKLFDFFKCTANMDCKFTTNTKFFGIFNGDKEPKISTEFGLYGSRLLYVNFQYAPYISGEFIKDSILIQKYDKYFKNMWELNTITTKNPSTNTTDISIEDLFIFDENPS